MSESDVHAQTNHGLQSDGAFHRGATCVDQPIQPPGNQAGCCQAEIGAEAPFAAHVAAAVADAGELKRAAIQAALARARAKR